MIHSLNKMLLAARVASRASKNSWSFEAFTCFHFTAEHGFSYRSTTICHCAKYGQNQRLFRSQNSKSSQTRLLLLFFLQILPLERNKYQQHRVLLFYMEKNRLLQEPIKSSNLMGSWLLAKFRSYLAEVSREREVWSLFSIFPLPPPPPYSLTFALAEHVHSVSHVVVGAD